MKKYNRRILREKTLQVLYAFEMHKDGLTTLINGVFSDVENKIDRDFGAELVNKVVANRTLLDEKISERVANWEMERIALIDKILLRIGITEIMYFQDIPPKVSINEVIEIAKNYSTSNSGKFINGILDAILTDLKDSGELTKSGRGLIEESIIKKTE
ncbi:MAG: transcription antitermination factor NusB [Bacteroidetes bacterium]|nr:transcription antitermination factor NusB [Bacteroidota bacterium]